MTFSNFYILRQNLFQKTSILIKYATKINFIATSLGTPMALGVKIPFVDLYSKLDISPLLSSVTLHHWCYVRQSSS